MQICKETLLDTLLTVGIILWIGGFAKQDAGLMVEGSMIFLLKAVVNRYWRV